MQYDRDRKLNDLTVGEFEDLTRKGFMKVLKWGVFLYFGVPVLIFGAMALFGLITYHLAQSAS